jgi:hypothetical protein
MAVLLSLVKGINVHHDTVNNVKYSEVEEPEQATEAIGGGTADGFGGWNELGNGDTGEGELEIECGLDWPDAALEDKC